MQPTPKAVTAGKRMREALDLIRRKPGIYDVQIDRELGGPITDRLLRAGLVRFEAAPAGRKLYLHNQLKVDPEPPTGSHLLRRPMLKEPKEDLIKHNVHAVKCPVCKSNGGQLCRSLKTNQEVRFPHSGRIGEAVYVLSLLLDK